MNSDSEMKEVLFDLANDALYVANGGYPFTRKGVIGICASHLSEKIGDDSDNYGVEDKELIDKIRQREIKTYSNDPNRLKSDSRGEQEISHDYGGRFVWELLQNADDVMGANERPPADLIGSKGLGFKSVLEITEEPEIHSGPFHFKFSPDQTKELLKKKDIHSDPPQLMFRIPHDCPPNDKVYELLDAGYSTVIRLPFRDEGAREKAKGVLEALEPYFLLLSQQLESVRIIVDREESHFRIERETQGFSDGKVALYTPEGRADWQRWVATEDIAEAKRLTVALALPLDENGKAVSYTGALPFHVFFPTEEQLGVKALLHASFDLQQNRKHLREGNYDTELLDLLGTVLEKVTLDIPARTALKTFVPIPEESGSGPLERIKRTIREKIRSTPFVPVIGGRKVSPPEGKRWKDKLGEVLRTNEQVVKDASLVTPELSDLSNILKGLGAAEIEGDEYVRLLLYCRNESLEDCIDSLRVLTKGGLKHTREQLDLLRAIPCWWTEGERPRPLTDRSPLLLKQQEDWPDWLATDSLHPEFRAEIEKWEKRQEEVDIHSKYEWEWEKLTERFLSRSPQHYIDWVLIPFVKKWELQDWKQYGFNVLKFLELWESQYKFDQTEPCIKGEEGRRNTLSTVLHLPTDKGWLPAIDCFAGKDWDGPEAFDEFFKDRKGAGIVQAFEKWPADLRETNQDKWKGLLRWVGVSWEPKVRRTAFEVYEHDLWSNYSKEAGDHTSGRQGKNYIIEQFPDCTRGIKKTKLLQDVFLSLFGLARRNAERFHYAPHLTKSLAFYQLAHEAWLPVSESILEARSRIPPNEAFLPNKGLNGLLPEVDHSGIDKKTWYGEDIESKLYELGVMDRLPDDVEKWHEWMRKLAEKGDNLSEEAPSNWQGGGKLWKAARSLYGGYLQREISGLFPDEVKIPCVYLKNRQRTLHFSPPSEVHWIDEPHLTDSALQTKLLKREYELFIFRLKKGGNPERLGVQKLSSAIKCHPDYQLSDDSETNTLRQRYAARRVALEKVMEIKFPEVVDIKAVTNLSLKLSENGQDLPSCPVLSWREAKTDSVLVKIGKKKWRALAHALAHRLENEKFTQHKDTFETYLSEDDEDEVFELLRQNGVPEEALEEVENSFQQSMQNEQSEEETESGSKDFPLEYNHTSPAAPSVSDSVHQSSEDGEDTEKQTTSHDGYEAGQSTSRNGSETTQNKDKSKLGTSRNVPQSDSGNGQSRAGRQRLNGETRPGYPRPESGSEAQQWLGTRLHGQWPDVDPDPRDKIGRDFTLSVGGRKVHIEAKHVENRPGAIHWSDRQYELAEETNRNEDAYFIAVLSPDRDGENEYSIHWIWDPLEHMKDMDRNVTWSGKSEPEQLQTGDWNVDALKPSSVPSKNFSIEVKLTNDVFDKKNRDGPQLEKLRARIESLNGVAEQETAEAQLG